MNGPLSFLSTKDAKWREGCFHETLALTDANRRKRALEGLLRFGRCDYRPLPVMRNPVIDASGFSGSAAKASLNWAESF